MNIENVMRYEKLKIIFHSERTFVQSYKDGCSFYLNIYKT